MASLETPTPRQRILVTGADGFIGTEMRRHLADLNAIYVARADCDLLDRDAANALIREHEPTHILHLAGIIHAADLRTLYGGNVVTTTNLLSAVMTHAAYGCRILIPGSCAEYGALKSVPATEDMTPHPTSNYGMSKLWQHTAALEYNRRRGMEVVAARIFNIIHPTVPPSFFVGSVTSQLAAIRAGAPARITVGDTTAVRDYLDLDDVCSALRVLLLKGHGGEVYNVCSGRPITVGELLTKLVAASGLDVEIVSDVYPPRDGDIPVSYGSPAKIQHEFGWKPQIPLDESIRRAVV